MSDVTITSPQEYNNEVLVYSKENEIPIIQQSSFLPVKIIPHVDLHQCQLQHCLMHWVFLKEFHTTQQLLAVTKTICEKTVSSSGFNVIDLN